MMNTVLVAVLVLITFSVSFVAGGAPVCDPISPGFVLDFELPAISGGSNAIVNPACNDATQSTPVVNGNYARFGLLNGGIAHTSSAYDNGAHSAYSGSQYAFISSDPLTASDARVFVSSMATSNKQTSKQCRFGLVGNNWKPYYIGFWYSVQATTTSAQLFTGAATIEITVIGGEGENTVGWTFPISWCGVGSGWKYYATPYFCSFVSGGPAFSITINANSGPKSRIPANVLIDNLSIQQWMWGNALTDPSNNVNNQPVDNLYLGCFDNSIAPDGVTIDIGNADYTQVNTNYVAFQDSQMTPDLCQSYCATYSFAYSSINAFFCYCGRSYGNRGQLADVQCNQPCAGDSSKMCGATGTLTKSSDYKSPYMGCFNEGNVFNGQTRDLEQFITSSDGMSVGYCRSICSSLGYTYAGIAMRGWCSCGNTFGRYGKTAESNCNYVCPGGTVGVGPMCGGNYVNSIFVAGSGVKPT